MNPLQKISNWLDAQPENLKKELIYFAMYFHPDQEIRDSDLRDIAPFMNYLNYEKDSREVVTRAMMAIKLIDFGFSGRGTEERWTLLLDRNLAMASRAKEMGRKAEFVDAFFDSFAEEKARWISKNNEWESFKLLELSDTTLADWHFTSDGY